MEFLSGYLIGAVATVAIIVACHNPVTEVVIDRANAACADNKGLKEIDGGQFHCKNGAKFERGDQ